MLYACFRCLLPLVWISCLNFDYDVCIVWVALMMVMPLFCGLGLLTLFVLCFSCAVV